MGPGRGVRIGRLAAPVVFLAAVIVVFSIAVSSGVVGGDDPVAPAPSPKASKSAKPAAAKDAKAASDGTRTYTVKPGDTLSGIADRFGTTVTEIEDLNADDDLTTLTPGQKLTVPAQ
jgi:LysM repeat protein